jgi:beta-aspartyl-peptidase (threonine type)
VLRQGGTALDAVEAAVRVLEEKPAFNAGVGSVANSEGDLQMDASMMDGRTLDVGAVGALKGVRHPVSVARRLLLETPTLLVAEGAYRFAAGHGAELAATDELLATEEAGKGDDTVGCVALDRYGHVASAVSTGGLPGSAPGRLGDSALPGAGFYADDSLGAVAFSGDGESIARAILAARVMQGLETLPPQQAVERALAALKRVGGEAGAVVVDARGRIGWAHKSSHFAVAYATSEDDEPHVFLKKSEEA